MALPSLVEIVPPADPVRAEVAVPGSKSLTNRALVLAALADGVTTLTGALWSEDTEVMVGALGQLGFDVSVRADPAEPANRTLQVVGQGGRIPRGGTAESPLRLYVGNAGTAARFLTALSCLGDGAYRLEGVPRMHQRPQAALFDALRALGYRLDAAAGTLPVVVHGGGPRPGRVSVRVDESSQFASALILCAAVGGFQVDVAGTADADEMPYVEMTRALVGAFPSRGGTFAIEPDASSASYFGAADWLLRRAHAGASVRVRDFPESGWQVDARFPRYLPLPSVVSRERDLGDSIMTAIALAPLADGPRRFTDLARLRVQECERVAALRTELSRCGAHVVERGDSLEITPGPLHGARIATYGDHRMAMCFATLGLAVPGIQIEDPACVKKTFPNFFAKLAAPPPGGLGATVLDVATGRAVTDADLLAG